MSFSINNDIAAEVVLPSPAPDLPNSVKFRFCATTAMNILNFLSDGKLNEFFSDWSLLEWKDLEVFDGDDVKDFSRLTIELQRV